MTHIVLATFKSLGRVKPVALFSGKLESCQSFVKGYLSHQYFFLVTDTDGGVAYETADYTVWIIPVGMVD